MPLETVLLERQDFNTQPLLTPSHVLLGEDGEEDVGEEDNRNTERMRASLHSTEELRVGRYIFPKATDKAKANPTEESSACPTL